MSAEDATIDPPKKAKGKKTESQKIESAKKTDETTRQILTAATKTANVYSLGEMDNDEDDNNVNAVQLGYQWVMGTGKAERLFDENSKMGNQMQGSYEVQVGVDIAINNFDKGINNGASKITRSAGKENEILYVLDFYADLHVNTARAFHGSYSGEAKVIGLKKGIFGNTYTMNVTLKDKMSAVSGTRYPPFLGGYSGKALLSENNPFGSKGQFRTIKLNYNMTYEVYKFHAIK